MLDGHAVNRAPTRGTAAAMTPASPRGEIRITWRARSIRGGTRPGPPRGADSRRWPAAGKERSPSPPQRPRGSSEALQRLVQIGDDIVDMFDADRDAHHVRPRPRGDQLGLAQLAVRGRGGMDDQRARIADIGEMAEQLDLRDQLHPGVVATLQPEGEHRPALAAEISVGERLVGIGLEPGIGHPCHLLVVLQPFGHGERIGAVPFHAQRERFHPGQRQPCVLRGHGRPKVTQAKHAAGRDEGDRPDGLQRIDEHGPVIGSVGLRQAGKLVPCRLPVELARIHDHPADRIAVTVEELGRRMRHDVRAVFERTAQHRRGHRVVDDQRDAVIMRDIGNRRDVGDHAARIGEALDEPSLGLTFTLSQGAVAYVTMQPQKNDLIGEYIWPES